MRFGFPAGNACALLWPRLARSATHRFSRTLRPLILAALATIVTAGASPALAQYSLGTSTTPFTSPGQSITLSYFLGNATATPVTVTATFNGQLGSPSCANPVQVAAGTTKACTFTYLTSLTDVSANAIMINSQWSFCDTTGCNSTYTDNNVLSIKYQGAPVITGASIAAPYNSPGTAVDLSSHVTGSTLYLSVAGPPAHGSAAVNGTVITYVPATGYYGADTFTYSATGPNGTSSPATISVTVATPPAPTAAAASANIAYNSPGTPIDLTSKVSGVVTALAVAAAPSHGTASVSGNVITYTPATGYAGGDSFTYTATGPGGTSSPATVTIIVSLPPAPTAGPAIVAVPYNSPGTAIDLTSKISGYVTSIAVAGGPSHGTISINGNVVTYTPAAGTYGPDSFTYTATGPGGTSSPATVSLLIPIPSAPLVAAASLAVPYNSAGTPIDLTSKITGAATSMTVASGPSHGTVTTSGNVVTYSPATGYFGADSFTYTATGPGGQSAPATVSIAVATPGAPTAAPAAGSVAYNSAGTAFDLTAKVSGVVTSLSVASGPGHGTTTISGTVITYIPAPGYTGPDSFTYVAIGPGGTSAPAAVTISVTPPVVVGGTITLKLVTGGKDGNFGFVTTIAGSSTFALATSGGSATKTLTSVPVGTQSMALTSLPAGFQLQSVQCNGTAASGTTASVAVTNGSATTCTFATTASQPAVPSPSETIRNLMRSRANALASSGPDTGRRHARVLGSLAGDDDEDAPQPTEARPPVSGPGNGAGPIASAEPPRPGRFANAALAPQRSSANIEGNVQDGNGQMSFSTSLSQIRQSAREREAAQRSDLGGVSGPAPPPGSTRPALFDIWIEAHTSMYADDTGGGKRRGNADLLYLGADVLVSKSVLVGALIQFDRAREQSSVLGTSVSGSGWMAGPYITARLSKNVLFDARAAWGQSTNQITPFGTYQDSFATSRTLMSAKLSGNWHNGAWRFSPSVDVTYFQEQQKAYTSVTGAAVADQAVALGRVSIGPEVGYKFKTGNGGVFEPYTSLKALWDFKRDAVVSIGGMDVGTAAVRGKAEAGATYTTPSGVSIKGAASYDGLGDRNFHAIEGKVSVSVPLP